MQLPLCLRGLFGLSDRSYRNALVQARTALEYGNGLVAIDYHNGSPADFKIEEKEDPLSDLIGAYHFQPALDYNSMVPVNKNYPGAHLIDPFAKPGSKYFGAYAAFPVGKEVQMVVTHNRNRVPTHSITDHVA